MIFLRASPRAPDPVPSPALRAKRKSIVFASPSVERESLGAVADQREELGVRGLAVLERLHRQDAIAGDAGRPDISKRPEVSGRAVRMKRDCGRQSVSSSGKTTTVASSTAVPRSSRTLPDTADTD